MNNILDEILNSVKSQRGSFTEEYKQAVSSKYMSYIEYSELPPVFLQESIDGQNLPFKLNQLYKSVQEIIDNRYNYVLRLRSYKEAGFITSLLMHQYFKQCLLSDNTVQSILYIDTNLLLKDYKKLMDRDSSTVSPELVHSLNTIYSGIENATYVFWDKFTMIQSNYDISKIYDILSIRYRKCLGNIFFVTQPLSEMTTQLSAELLDVMNSGITVDLTKSEFIHK